MRATSRRRALTNPTRTSLNSKSGWAKFSRGDCARMRAQSPLREINLKVKEWTQLSLLRRDTEFLRTNATKMIGARSRAAWMVRTHGLRNEISSSERGRKPPLTFHQNTSREE